MNNYREINGLYRRRIIYYGPLFFSVFWMIFPFLLMIVSPIKLDIISPALVVLYVLLNIVAFCVGYSVVALTTNFDLAFDDEIEAPLRSKVVIVIGSILAGVLLPFSIYVYTGKSILDISVIADQAAVYADLANALEVESIERKLTSLIRGLAAPLTLAVLPIATFFWPRLSIPYKIAAIVVPFTYAIFSAFRGTDKEIGDIFTLIIVGVISRLAFFEVNGRRLKFGVWCRYLLLICLLGAIFFAIFIIRKSERMGGFSTFCFYGDVACFFPLGINHFDDMVNFSIAMISSYLIQGYYGLSLALQLEYQWTWGIGHSQPLQVIYGLAGDTKEIYNAGLMAALRGVGWDDRAVWSSIFPNLAGDIGFAGVPILFLLIGALYAKSWIVLLERISISAIMTFSLLTILVFYIPANNQLAQSFDLYFASIFWMGAFILKRCIYVQK